MLRIAAAAAILFVVGVAFSGAQQNEASMAGGRLFIPQSVMARYCLTMVSPNYPPGFDAQKSAVVVLRVTIRKTGNVVPLSAVSGPHELESAAMDAARLWRYKPYVKNEEAIEVVTDIPIEFSPGRLGGMITHPTK
jgi:TonB family protein